MPNTFEALAPSECSLDGKRDRVGFRLVPFADAAFEIRARSVEITQHHRAQPLIGAVILQRLLHHPFGAAIGIDRRLPVCLVDRHLFRQSVGRAGGGENERRDTGIDGGGKQVERTDDVIVVKSDRLLDRFADFDERGEVKDGFRSVLGEDLVQPRPVANIALFERPQRTNSSCPLERLSKTTGSYPRSDRRRQV